jgi:hypothetical protein
MTLIPTIDGLPLLDLKQLVEHELLMDAVLDMTSLQSPITCDTLFIGKVQQKRFVLPTVLSSCGVWTFP